MLTEVGEGVPFSRAVRAAMRLGYTEPDPRDDLSGMDVARKALILARLLGYRGELNRAAVESLVPKWARALPLPEFLERLGELDAAWKRRVDAARAQGNALRYVATVTPTKIAVGLRAVPLSSPLASLKGSDNQLGLHHRALQGEPAGDPRSRRRRRGDGRRRAERHPAPGGRMSGAVTAFAPGSIGNVGPGLDILGLAVAGDGDAVRAEWLSEPGIRILDPGHPELPREAERHTSGLAARAVLRRAGEGAARRQGHRPLGRGRGCRSRADRAAAPPPPSPARWR